MEIKNQCCQYVNSHLKELLKTTVPLVSYTRNSLRFWYYAFLSTCCQNLEKIGVTRKIWEKAGVKLLRDLTKRSVSFSTLATSDIRLLLFLVKRINKRNQSDWWEKIHDHRRKTRENDICLTKQSPFLSPDFIRGSAVIVISHNVELCEQYFLQECLLLIRKSYN